MYVYVLESVMTGAHYVGSCRDIGTRLKEHNDNKVISTKHKGPFKVIHAEIFNSRSEAVTRERQIKSYKGGRFFKKLISASPSSSLA